MTILSIHTALAIIGIVCAPLFFAFAMYGLVRLWKHGNTGKRSADKPVPTVVNSAGVRIVFFEIEYHVPDEWSDEKAVQQTMMFCSVLLDAYEHRDEEQHYHRAAQVRDFMRGCPTYLPNARANYRHMQQQMQKRQQP